ncbi:MAG: nitroreductase family protein [Oscillospiraceae bacterium]|nr:nitroreductase family protein [Oscillospiraceae bacterium]
MELMEAIRKRVSARKFSDTPISGDIITEMLDAARLVPTPGMNAIFIPGIHNIQ